MPTAKAPCVGNSCAKMPDTMTAATIQGPLDATVPLLRDPYRYVSRACAEAGADAIDTRIGLERALLVTGTEAARFFYAPSFFRRADAVPRPLRKTLFGEGGVQGLDGPEHIRRKALYMQIIGPGRVAPLAERAVETLRARLERGDAERFAGQDIFAHALAEAVADWAGVPLETGEADWLAETFGALYEGSGQVAPGHLKARLARARSDRWAERLVRRVRSGEVTPPEGSALAVLADWRDLSGARLPARVAAVELGGLMRPFTAVSVFLTFAGHALATHRGLAERLRETPELVSPFVEEVRRIYPFFPVIAARTAKETGWRGHALPEGLLVLLDVWGTNRDPATWEAPDSFRPERFERGKPGTFDMIPQGGGVHATGHRCAGEWATRAVMERATRDVLLRLNWAALPEQDLSLDMRALPALPRDRLRLPAGLYPA